MELGLMEKVTNKQKETSNFTFVSHNLCTIMQMIYITGKIYT